VTAKDLHFENEGIYNDDADQDLLQESMLASSEAGDLRTAQG
jgi:hypothetical protein